MKIRVDRFFTDGKATVGRLYINSVFQCYTLEDREQERQKVYGSTRIWEGQYPVKLRAEGGVHAKYLQRFPSMHKGTLWIKDVPEFEWILIHLGNSISDTLGCLLVGMDWGENPSGATLVRSTEAYTTIYPLIAEALTRGEEVTIKFNRFDRGLKKVLYPLHQVRYWLGGAALIAASIFMYFIIASRK